MEIIYLPSPKETAALGTAGLRDSFLLEDLFRPGELTLVATDLDRAVVGAAVPTGRALELSCPEELGATHFCERRELGVLNLGGPGMVMVDGDGYDLGARECLYVGRGSREVSFRSASAEDPAVFYLVSYPAHTAHPTTRASAADATRVELGSADECNERTIFQYIHEGGIKSCQLAMGFTELSRGSNWNTMPPHTHLRRSEIYCYFDVPDGHRVLHMMGEPQETRPLWVADRQAVLAPAWSIHCGCGTSAYRFAWAMGGENRAFTDMDGEAVSELR